MTDGRAGRPAPAGAGWLETKLMPLGETLALDAGGAVVEGYASLFGVPDQGGDIVEPGAYRASLEAMRRGGRRVRFLWQHDPAEPIGIWEELREDGRGLRVRGRILTGLRRGAEALELIRAGAIDGLSIGYRVRKARRDEAGRRRLIEVELWEVSLVTFPMLPGARLEAPAAGRREGKAWSVAGAAEGAARDTAPGAVHGAALARAVAQAMEEARRLLG